MDRSVKLRLLSLVRRAWSDPFITVEHDPDSGWRIDAVVAAVQDLHGYESEEEALVVALESAPKTPDVSELTEEIDRLTEEVDRLKGVCNSYLAKLERERGSTVAFVRGAAQERAAVVAWLRAEAEAAAQTYTVQAGQWANRIDALADDIERGEHRSEGDE